MKRFSYRDRDYAFGQTMLTLRAAIGLTQTGLADFLGVSRRAVGDWEAGSSYPKAEHLKQFIALAVKQRAFPAGNEAEAVRVLWQAAHQKILLDEQWLASLLAPERSEETRRNAAIPLHPMDDAPRMGGSRNALIKLPFQPTSFIGRAAELAEIARIVSDPACRLLTLYGPGGVGKTRLGLEVAARQAHAFPDGVIFVALASLNTPNQIVSTIGDALNLSFAGQPHPDAYLLGYLHERHMLLLLDNFEHLLEGADLVYDILKNAPNVTILVTSRARLHLQSEWLFDVEGLSYPLPDARSPLQSRAELADYSAVELFLQRATQVQSGFPLTEATLATVVRICQHVAGMPLAIELAAAGVRTLTSAEIEAQIRLNLDVLATTLRDVPARHRSMRAVFDHSWNLLSEPERALFSRLAVFRGGCTRAAAEQIAGATLPALATQVDKSLLRQNSGQARSSAGRDVPGGAAEPRFVLLEPLREYALEQLAAQGEVEALQHAHATYYLGLAEAAAAHWDTPSVDSAIELLDREHDNLRVALRWALDGGDLTIGLQLGGALWRFWRGSGFINEGRVWLADLLALDDDTASPAAMSARIRALNGAAWLASDQHDFGHAALLFEHSIALRRALGETEDETNLLLNAAREARAAGQYHRAIALLEDALSRQRALGNRGSSGSAGMGLSLYELALVLREQGDLERAAMLYEECMEFHREIGDLEGMNSALLGLGDVARDRGDAAGVRMYSEQSLAFFRDLGIQWAIGFALNNLAQAAYLEGNLAQAAALARESVSLFRDLKDDGGLAEVLITMGHILRAQGSVEAAREALTEALRLARVVGPRLLMAAALEGLAGVIAQPTEAALAVRLLGAAAALRVQMGAPVRPVDLPGVEHTLATAKSSLGGDIFAALWSEAGEQSLEQTLFGAAHAALVGDNVRAFDPRRSAGGDGSAHAARPIAGSS